MRRLAFEMLDALARAFFATVRRAAALTGWSFGNSAAAVFLLASASGVIFVRVAHGLVTFAVLGVVTIAAVRALGIVKRYDAAFAARDFVLVTRLRAWIEGKGEPRSPKLRAIRNVGDGELLLAFEKWEEAADAFAAIALSDLPATSRPGILSELGYARAHAGDAEKGVDDIERGLALADAMPAYPKEKRWYVRRRYGIALSLAGDHARALDALEDVCAGFEGSAREWAETHFFIGRSRIARGETQAAADAFASAVTGDGPFVARAWKELEEIADPAKLDVLRREIEKDRVKKN